jgi:voltage-gated potassium channel
MKQRGQGIASREVSWASAVGRYRIQLPQRPVRSPLRQVGRRLAMAMVVLAAAVLIVYIGRDQYHDNADGKVDFLDSVYYATVTLSTTGYGDIVPYGDTARLLNVLFIAPLRVIFLIILIGTILEVLHERTREAWRLNRWRSTLRDHTVVVGFGTKGRSALQTLTAKGLSKDRVVVVDTSQQAIDAAGEEGFAGVLGDATRSDVLVRAEAQRAARVIITTHRDDTAALVALTARQLNRGAKVVSAVREEENAPLLRQSGADAVIISSSAAGRLLGLSVLSPSSVTIIEDLIRQGSGLDVIERPVVKSEVGRSPREVDDLVVAVLRGHRLLGYDDPKAGPLEATDRLITIVRARPQTAEPG